MQGCRRRNYNKWRGARSVPRNELKKIVRERDQNRSEETECRGHKKLGNDYKPTG